MESALAQLARGGTLVLVGTGLAKPTLDPHRVLLNELVVTGAYNYDANGFTRALELLSSGGMPLDDLVEPEDYPLEALPLVLDKLKEQALAGKALISPPRA
jgi:threonine dehydrogenase-like Zn-dependent dehydrogenase